MAPIARAAVAGDNVGQLRIDNSRHFAARRAELPGFAGDPRCRLGAGGFGAKQAAENRHEQRRKQVCEPGNAIQSHGSTFIRQY